MLLPNRAFQLDFNYHFTVFVSFFSNKTDLLQYHTLIPSDCKLNDDIISTCVKIKIKDLY